MKKAYLLAYNGICCTGWAFCVYRTIAAAAAGSSPKDLWAEVGTVCTVVQTLMLLEILHALIGLVPSPVVTVAMQVGSRIFVLWGHTYWVPEGQQHWSLFPMLFAWGVTEVVRYLFYFCNLLGHVPFPLFWLRYSLFMVLYPMGITGEMFQTFVGMGAHWKGTFWYRMSVVTVLVYVPGSPYMILNMWGNRKRSLKKRLAEDNPKPAEEPEGVAWPMTKKGDRSSTDTNKAILAAAAGAGPGGAAAAQKINGEKNWRFKYNKHFLEHVKECLESKDACLNMSRAGLASAQEEFKLIRKGQAEVSMKKAMEVYGNSDRFETAELSGSKPTPSKRELALQYGGPTAGKPYYKYKSTKTNEITRLQLRQQLDAWVEYGTIEPDVADALKNLQGNQEKWLDLSDTYFVLLGAASAMGPLSFLLSLGANVVAVARSGALKGIFSKVKDSPGKLFFPVKKGADWKKLVQEGDFDALSKVSGCDLLKEPPEIANWLETVAPGKKLCVGNYTYLDGALHVQIAVACDVIMEKLCKARANTALAFLPTPTDALVVTEESAAAAKTAYKSAPVWAKVYQALGVLKPNRAVEVGGFKVIDSIEPVQGPNYILAKRLQHWRSVVAREDGHPVSTNVSPTTATQSVMLKSSIVAAIGGMHIFKPMEVVYQELSMTVMAALLIHDLKNPESAAQPSTKLAHPLCLLQKTSFNGGLWRCPYSMTSIAIPSAIYFYVAHYWHAILVVIATLLSITRYAITGAVPLSAILPDSTPGPVAALARMLSVPL